MAAEVGGEEQDQSMEEILQSIKRIIADEDDAGGGDAPQAELEAMELAEEAPDEMAPLDLTEVMELEDEVVAAPPPPPSKPAPKSDVRRFKDPLAELLSEDAAEETAVSFRALSQAKFGEKSLPKIDSPLFRSGYTVEDIVLEALRPMLREWLDANLPNLVEALVQREIRRISS